MRRALKAEELWSHLRSFLRLPRAMTLDGVVCERCGEQ